MLNIKIFCIGKLKEQYLKDAEIEYLKRLSKYSKIEIIELAEEKFDTSSLSLKEKEKIKEIECDKIIDKLKNIDRNYIFCLDLKGKTYTSEKLAEKISNISTYESSTISFIIGGSLGLSESILNRSSEKISFSTLTFPHQLIRIFLLEQVFRTFKILNNENYHY